MLELEPGLKLEPGLIIIVDSAEVGFYFFSAARFSGRLQIRLSLADNRKT